MPCSFGSFVVPESARALSLQRLLVRQHGDQDAAAPAFSRLSSPPDVDGADAGSWSCVMSRKVAAQIRGRA